MRLWTFDLHGHLIYMDTRRRKKVVVFFFAHYILLIVEGEDYHRITRSGGKVKVERRLSRKS